MRVFYIILFIGFFYSINDASGQNYQCLQTGIRNYFTNTNGYLRGIRIDSVSVFPDSTIYYPFHTPRGSWMPSGLGGYFANLDSTGGSWLGKKVKQLNDGAFLFDNLWGDTIVIRTQSTISDTWIFCRDTSAHYYMATLTAIDTMTFLGIFDSVKTITINAYNSIAPDVTDSLNGFQIKLSKNNGFVQVFDLYTFPYHKPDTVWGQGNDFYLDQSLAYGGSGYTYPPNANNSIFRLVTFINPTSNQLYEASIGDVFETAHTFCYCPSPGSPSSYKLDTIITKTVLPHSVIYTTSGLTGTIPATYSAGGYTTDDSTYLFDTSKMPEETNSNIYSFYFPDDSGYCTNSPSYLSGLANYLNGYTNSYKIGFGLTYHLYISGDPSYWKDQLIYADINNISCGTYYALFPSRTNALSSVNCSLTIFPNPTTTALNINASNTIKNVTITNLFGQTLYANEYNATKVQVDISNLPSGMYYVNVNGVETRKFVKE